MASVKTKAKAFEDVVNKYHAEIEVVTTIRGRPLDYMGFEFHRNKTIMRESIMIRMTKKARQISKQDKINPKDAASLLSSVGWIYHTDTYGMYEKCIKPCVEVGKLKKIVSKNQRRLNRNANKLADSRGNAGRKAIGA